MKQWMIALLLMVFGVGLTGCRAEAEIDDDDGEVKVDVDD